MFTHSTSKEYMQVRSKTRFKTYKSWYKVDLDGEFITKYNKKNESAKKKITKERNEEEMTPEEMIRKSLAMPHAVVLEVGVHSIFILLFMLISYYGFSMLWYTPVLVKSYRHKRKS